MKKKMWFKRIAFLLAVALTATEIAVPVSATGVSDNDISTDIETDLSDVKDAEDNVTDVDNQTLIVTDPETGEITEIDGYMIDSELTTEKALSWDDSTWGTKNVLFRPKKSGMYYFEYENIATYTYYDYASYDLGYLETDFDEYCNFNKYQWFSEDYLYVLPIDIHADDDEESSISISMVDTIPASEILGEEITLSIENPIVVVDISKCTEDLGLRYRATSDSSMDLYYEEMKDRQAISDGYSSLWYSSGKHCIDGKRYDKLVITGNSQSASFSDEYEYDWATVVLDEYSKTIDMGALAINENKTGTMTDSLHKYTVEVPEDGIYRIDFETDKYAFMGFDMYKQTDDGLVLTRKYKDSGQAFRNLHKGMNYSVFTTYSLKAGTYVLKFGSEWQLEMARPVKYNIGITRDHERIVFDYDLYNAFLASGGTVTYVSPEDDIDPEMCRVYSNYWTQLDEDGDNEFRTEEKVFCLSCENFLPEYKGQEWWPTPLLLNKKEAQFDNAMFSNKDSATVADIEGVLKRDWFTTDGKSLCGKAMITTGMYKTVGNDLTQFEAATLGDSVGTTQLLLAKRQPLYVYVQKIVVIGDTTMKKGATQQLSCDLQTLNQWEASNQKVTYSSSDKSVLTVDANGLVKAVGTGTAKITVKSADKLKKTGTITITVGSNSTKAYLIQYKNLDGAVNHKDNPATYKSSEAVSLKKPTKKGYTFDGWYDNAEFEGEAITSIAKDSSEDKTVYAKWIPNAYTLKFALNSSQADGEGINPIEAVYCNGSEVILPTPNQYQMKRAYYDFTSWNTKADGTGTTYYGDKLFSGVPSSNGQEITLYAQWTKHKYTVSYDLTASLGDFYVYPAPKNSSDNIKSWTVSTSTFTLVKPKSLKGFKFKGWYTNLEDADSKVTKLVKGTARDIELYAKWEPISYRLKFNANGGKLEWPEELQEIISSLTTESHLYTDWVDMPYIQEGSSAVYPGDDDDDQMEYLYAYEGGKYWIERYDEDDDYWYDEDVQVLSKKGYYFDGWNTKADGSGKDVYSEFDKLTSTDGATVTLYAQWKPMWYANNYYNVEGAKNTSNKIYHKYNATYELKNPTKTGYVFKGWYKNPEFTGTKVTEIPKKTFGAVDLYAKWAPMTNKVVFDQNGGKGTDMKKLTLTYDTESAIPACSYKKSGRVFKGWNTKADGKGTMYYPEDVIDGLLKMSNGKTITLYAIWGKPIS